jgi:hypothetical protein
MRQNYGYSKKEVAFSENSNIPSMSILIHSRTVLEKEDNVSTGILTYVEGDMMEVEMGDYQIFELGDLVKITIYTPAGIFMFHTTIIAKDNRSLVVIHPPENRKKFSEKRLHTRIDLEQKGLLSGLWAEGSEEKQIFSQSYELSVNNISQSGIGFTIEGDLKLNQGEHIEIHLDFGVKLSCKALIMRIDDPESILYYGAELIDIPQDQMIALRAFILKSQIDLHMNRKKDDTTIKRVFK